jgi:hypothetical protein
MSQAASIQPPSEKRRTSHRSSRDLWVWNVCQFIATARTDVQMAFLPISLNSSVVRSSRDPFDSLRLLRDETLAEPERHDISAGRIGADATTMPCR